jgi:hypothetical protein
MGGRLGEWVGAPARFRAGAPPQLGYNLGGPKNFMQTTKLQLATRFKKSLEESGPRVQRLLKQDEKEGLPGGDGEKAANQLFVWLKVEIEREGPTFKEENEAAVQEISALTKSCSETLKFVEGAVKQLRENYQPAVAKQLLEKLKPVHGAPEAANQVKAAMVNHQEWRGSLPDATPYIGKRLNDLLVSTFLNYRDAPLKAYMDTKEKVAKTAEYKTRAEHFEVLIKGFEGENKGRSQIIELLGKDQLLVAKYVKEVSEVATDGLSDSKLGPEDLKKYVSKKGDMKAYLTRMSGLQNKLKVARSQVHSAQIISDGFLHKAGDLASNEGIKKMAQSMSQDVAKIRKQVEAFESAFVIYKNAFNKVSPTKI